MEHDQDKEIQQRVAAYQPSQQALEGVKDVPLLFAVGISGAGKDTLLRRLISRYPDDYSFLITTTTRPLRKNNGVLEVDGVDYYFIDKPTAERMLAEGAYVEVNYYAFNVYGASIAEIARGGQDHKILISDIDVNGIGNFVRLGMNVKPVFVLPPSYEVWRERVQGRYGNTGNPKDLQKRLATALSELEAALHNDYYYLVINDDLDKTAELLNAIAHNKPVERRDPQAVALTKRLAADIAAELVQPNVAR